VLCFALSNDLRTLISGSAGPELSVWELNEPLGNEDHKFEMKSDQKFTVNKPGFSEVRIRPDQKIFVSAGWDHRIRVFDCKKRSPLAILKNHTATVTSICFSPISGSNIFVSGSRDKRVALWSIY
jgi:WD40 repeat protein